MFKFDYDKYRGIIISIALFLLLDASVLILNFYISFEIAADAVGVNLAGRQRMLSQRMVKSLFDMRYSLETEGSAARAREELRFTRDLFDETLTAFDQGGQARGADGTPVQLEKATAPASLEAIGSTKALWAAYKTKIDAVLNLPAANGKPPMEWFDAIAYAQANNLALLRLMNDLTVDLEGVASSKATRLRTIQTLGITLAVINFIFILIHFIGQLRRSDQVIEAARKETRDILATVNDGLFLVHSDFTIGSQHSNRLHKLFNRENVSGLSLDELLAGLVSEKDLKTVMGYLRLMFNDNIKEGLVGDLNPLNEVTVNIDQGNGRYEIKHLSFQFKRVVDDKGIQSVLVTVIDVTQQVTLAHQLNKARQQSELQLEMFTSILHANPQLLREFIDKAYAVFERVNHSLRRPGRSGGDYLAKINEIFIEIHNFKGEAGALQLDVFERKAHEFEVDLAELKQKSGLRGNDFLKLAIKLEELISYTQAIEALADRLAEFGRIDNHTVSGNRRNWQHLYDLANRVAKRCGKSIRLATTGLDAMPEEGRVRGLVNNICIQLLRNAIVHGIESPSQRERKRKPALGRIDIRVARLDNGSLEISVQDDGQGLDFGRIRKKAVTSGKYTAEEVNGWDHKRLLSLIFEPGFSTAERISEDAGHGVGMDVIMKLIQSHSGKIALSCRRGLYSRFVVTLPGVSVARAA